jgi:hypothetical protein
MFLGFLVIMIRVARHFFSDLESGFGKAPETVTQSSEAFQFSPFLAGKPNGQIGGCKSGNLAVHMLHIFTQGDGNFSY